MTMASHRELIVSFARSSAMRRVAALIALGALAGCSSAKDMMGFPTLQEVPESAHVEAAPYPNLGDAPDPVPRLEKRVDGPAGAERRRGQAALQAMTRDADRLRADARRLDREKAGDRVVATQDQRAAKALAEEEAAVKAVDASEAERLRAEIEAELDAAFGQDAAPAAE